MASWGLLGGLGAGMSQAGQNMFEQAKQDRINEFRMQLQQEQNSHNSKESAADRQHRADLQADQQRFTAQQAQLKAKNDLAVAQAEGKRGNWDQHELSNGDIMLIDRYTGETRYVSSNPVLRVNGDANLPPPSFHYTGNTTGVGGANTGVVDNTATDKSNVATSEAEAEAVRAKNSRSNALRVKTAPSPSSVPDGG